MTEALRVRDALRLSALRGAEIVAGRSGLDRLVRSVNVMEVPDIRDWVQADELLLTTAYPLREEPDELARLVHELSDRGLAAIAVKPARYIARIPDAMLDAADRLSFPVLTLPPQASFNVILHGVFTVLVSRQAARLERGAEVHDRFNHIMLTGGRLPQVAQALSDAIDRPVAILDIDGSTRAATPGIDQEDLDEAMKVMANDRLGDRLTGVSNDGRSFVLQPLRAGYQTLGAIVAPGRHPDFEEDDLDALQHAATVSALSQVQARAVAEEERHFKTMCLEELVSARHVDLGTVVERTAAFGWNLHRPHVALVARYDVSDRGTGYHTPDDYTVRQLGDTGRAALGPKAIVWERSNEVAALLAVDGNGSDQARRLATALVREAARRCPGTRVKAGIGRIALGPEHLSRSFVEARQAVASDRWRHPPTQVHAFEDLGVERVLALCNAEDLEQYREDLVGVLVAYDSQRGTDLLETLDRFLAIRNVTAVARSLYIHPNTLRHRLARIESLIGPFTGDPDRYLALAVAIRVERTTQAI